MNRKIELLNETQGVRGVEGLRTRTAIAKFVLPSTYNINHEERGLPPFTSEPVEVFIYDPEAVAEWQEMLDRKCAFSIRAWGGATLFPETGIIGQAPVRQHGTPHSVRWDFTTRQKRLGDYDLR
jgi:hypothetical protein